MGDNNENDRVTSPESVPSHLKMGLHSDTCCKTKCQAIILVMVRGLDMLHATDLCHEMCVSGVTQWHMLHNICVMQSVSPCKNPNLMCHEIHVQSTLVISTSVISNNRLSRRENLVLVLIQKSKIKLQNIVEKRRNCSWGAISPLFHNIFNIYF